jgi:3-oxoacyl-[acyl-carrier-protein] synthase-3
VTIPRTTIAATAYTVPPSVESVEAVMEREKARIEAALEPLGQHARTKALEGLGLSRVHVCGAKQPYDLVLEAATAALHEAGLRGCDLHLIIDYSTLPGENSFYTSFAHALSRDLGTEASLNLSFKAGGCAGLHMAIKTALAWMAVDDNLRTALLITGDTPPEGNRSLLPVTVQGDAGSAVVLTRDDSKGPVVLDVEVMTLGHLHDVIALTTAENCLQIRVDSVRMENEVMPIYYLTMLQLIEKVLAKARLSAGDIDHFVYSNISQRDRASFGRMLNLPASKLPPTAMSEYGHTFASDLVINYTDLCRQGRISPGQLVLFASVGIGFMWGVTLART